ncbi:MAG: hypothetical protein JWM41_4907 [Gemmatimonadetes bacterium]|nr:hypothetical protein [Gemmatimonadota bacterium]
MNTALTSRADAATDIPPAATARRLNNQIARAFRGTYGARTGLRTIVRLTTHQMLQSGMPRDAIQRTLEQCVLNHPARLLSDPHNIVTGESQSTTLAQLTRQWSDEVTLDVVAE